MTTHVIPLDVAVKRLMEIDQESVFALADIAAERVRQIEAEGWTIAHDDGHARGEMARAAASYAYASSVRTGRAAILSQPEGGTDFINRLWPWHWKWWKPKSPHRDAVRAGALLVAELARHQRIASKAASTA